MKEAAKLYKTSQAEWRNFSEAHIYGWYMQWDKVVPNTLLYYDMKKKCEMWLGRDERVETKITVSKFGPPTSERLFRINQRIAQIRRDWSDRGGNM